ncbi:MAG: aspartyl/glutamyl-tRNA amidotransferase subunit C [Bacteroidales bacterium]|jgi:aspartyl/glutamyl-tRNA(Asn/Gln) amidotransferase C subunit|nr:aspartyl/glutamyl-tRNA amidotransferase subunit C [Bacteroidales bacterium]
MIDKNTLHQLASWSKLEIGKHEEGDYLRDMNRTVSFIHALNKISTEGSGDFDFVNHFKPILRDDRRKKFTNVDALKINAPEMEQNYFVVSTGIKKRKELG